MPEDYNIKYNLSLAGVDEAAFALERMRKQTEESYSSLKAFDSQMSVMSNTFDSLQKDMTGFTDKLLKTAVFDSIGKSVAVYNKQLFDLSRQSGVTGQSFTSLQKGIDDLNKTTRLSKVESAEFFKAMNDGVKGIKLTSQEITNLGQTLTTEYGPALKDVQGAMQDLMGLQHKQIDVLRRVEQGFKPGELQAYATSLILVNGASEKEIETLLRTAKAHDAQGKALTDSEKKLRLMGDSMKDLEKAGQDLMVSFGKPLVETLSGMAQSLANFAKSIEGLTSSASFQKLLKFGAWASVAATGVAAVAGTAIAGGAAIKGAKLIKDTVGYGVRRATSWAGGKTASNEEVYEAAGSIRRDEAAGYKTGLGGRVTGGAGRGRGRGAAPFGAGSQQGAGGLGGLLGGWTDDNPLPVKIVSGSASGVAQTMAQKATGGGGGAGGALAEAEAEAAGAAGKGGLLSRAGKFLKRPGVAAIGGLALDVAGGFVKESGHEKIGGGMSALGKVGGMAGLGAELGSIVGPWGTAVGAVVGGVVGLVQASDDLSDAFGFSEKAAQSGAKAIAEQTAMWKTNEKEMDKLFGTHDMEIWIKEQYETVKKAFGNKDFKDLSGAEQKQAIGLSQEVARTEQVAGVSRDDPAQLIAGYARKFQATELATAAAGAKGLSGKEASDFADRIVKDELRGLRTEITKGMAAAQNDKGSVERSKQAAVQALAPVSFGGAPTAEQSESIDKALDQERTHAFVRSLQQAAAEFAEIKQYADGIVAANSSMANDMVMLYGNASKARDVELESLAVIRKKADIIGNILLPDAKNDLAMADAQLKAAIEQKKTQAEIEEIAKRQLAAQNAVATQQASLNHAEREMLETKIKAGSASDPLIDVAGREASLIEQKIELTKQLNLGMGASLQLQIEGAQAYDHEEDLLKQKLATQKALLSDAKEAPMAKLAILDIESKILGVEQKRIGLVRNLREGYLDALTAFTNVEGSMSKLILTKDVGIGELMRQIKVPGGQRAGALGAGADSPDFRWEAGGKLQIQSPEELMRRTLKYDKEAFNPEIAMPSGNVSKAIMDSGPNTGAFFNQQDANRAGVGSGTATPGSGANEMARQIADSINKPLAGAPAATGDVSSPDASTTSVPNEIGMLNQNMSNYVAEGINKSVLGMPNNAKNPIVKSAQIETKVALTAAGAQKNATMEAAKVQKAAVAGAAETQKKEIRTEGEKQAARDQDANKKAIGKEDEKYTALEKSKMAEMKMWDKANQGFVEKNQAAWRAAGGGDFTKGIGAAGGTGRAGPAQGSAAGAAAGGPPIHWGARRRREQDEEAARRNAKYLADREDANKKYDPKTLAAQQDEEARRRGDKYKADQEAANKKWNEDNRGYATGGRVHGSDTVPAMLTPGEYVLPRDVVKKYGPLIRALHKNKFEEGGMVQPPDQGASDWEALKNTAEKAAKAGDAKELAETVGKHYKRDLSMSREVARPIPPKEAAAQLKAQFAREAAAPKPIPPEEAAKELGARFAKEQAQADRASRLGRMRGEIPANAADLGPDGLPKLQETGLKTPAKGGPGKLSANAERRMAEQIKTQGQLAKGQQPTNYSTPKSARTAVAEQTAINEAKAAKGLIKTGSRAEKVVETGGKVLNSAPVKYVRKGADKLFNNPITKNVMRAYNAYDAGKTLLDKDSSNYDKVGAGLDITVGQVNPVANQVLQTALGAGEAVMDPEVRRRTAEEASQRNFKESAINAAENLLHPREAGRQIVTTADLATDQDTYEGLNVPGFHKRRDEFAKNDAESKRVLAQSKALKKTPEWQAQRRAALMKQDADAKAKGVAPAPLRDEDKKIYDREGEAAKAEAAAKEAAKKKAEDDKYKKEQDNASFIARPAAFVPGDLSKNEQGAYIKKKNEELAKEDEERDQSMAAIQTKWDPKMQGKSAAEKQAATDERAKVLRKTRIQGQYLSNPERLTEAEAGDVTEDTKKEASRRKAEADAKAAASPMGKVLALIGGKESKESGHERFLRGEAAEGDTGEDNADDNQKAAEDAAKAAAKAVIPPQPEGAKKAQEDTTKAVQEGNKQGKKVEASVSTVNKTVSQGNDRDADYYKKNEQDTKKQMDADAKKAQAVQQAVVSQTSGNLMQNSVAGSGETPDHVGVIRSGIVPMNTLPNMMASMFGMASGGRTSRGGSSDTIPAMLSPGEYVVNARAASQHAALLESLNSNRFASGGPVIPSPSMARNSGGGGVFPNISITAHGDTKGVILNAVTQHLGKHLDSMLAPSGTSGRFFDLPNSG